MQASESQPLRSEIIRYTFAQLRALAKSPLVQRPPSLPEVDSYQPQPATQGRRPSTANADKDNPTTTTREGRERRQNRDNFPRPPKVSVDGTPLPDAVDESVNKDRKVFDSTGARISQTPKNQLPRVLRPNNQRDRDSNRDRDRDRSEKDPAWMADPNTDTSDSKQRRNNNNRRLRNEKSPEKSSLPSPSTHQLPANNVSSEQATSTSSPLSSTPADAPPPSIAKQQAPERTQFELGAALKSSNSSADNVDPRYKGLDAIQIFRLQMKQRERQERGEPDSPPPAPQQTSTTGTPHPGPFSFPAPKSLNEVEQMFFADLGVTPPSIPSVVSVGANSSNIPPVGPLNSTRGAMLSGLRGVAESPFLKHFMDDEKSVSSKASPLKSRFVEMFEPEQVNQQPQNQSSHQNFDQLNHRDGPGVNLMGLLGKMNSDGIAKRSQPGMEPIVSPVSASIHSEEAIIRQLKLQHTHIEQQNQQQFNIHQQQGREDQMRNQHSVDMMSLHQQQLQQNQLHKQQRLAALSAGLGSADSQRMSAMILQQLAGGGAADTTTRHHGLPEASKGRVDLPLQQLQQPKEVGLSNDAPFQQKSGRLQPGQQTQTGLNIPRGPSKKLMSEEDVLKIMGISSRAGVASGEKNRDAELPMEVGVDANRKNAENSDAADMARVMEMLSRSNMQEPTQQLQAPIHPQNHDSTSLSRQMQAQTNEGRGVPALGMQGGDGGATGGLPPQFFPQQQQQNALPQRSGPILSNRIDSPTNMAPLLQQQLHQQNQNSNQQPQQQQYNHQQIQQQMQPPQPHSGIPPYLMQQNQQQHHFHMLQQQQQLSQQRGGPQANGLQGPGPYIQQPPHLSNGGVPGFMNGMAPPMGQRFGPPQLPMNGQPPPPGMQGFPPGMLAGQGPPPGMIGLPPPGMFGGGGMGPPQGMLGMPFPPGMMGHGQPPPPGLGGMPPGMMGPPPGFFGGMRGGSSPPGGDDMLAMMIQNSVAGRKAGMDGVGLMGQMQQQHQQQQQQQQEQHQQSGQRGFLD
ncbi:hypothetical protein HDU77_000035 [Chytriomyces hyalinus]|nr:hypothetical protein HDU77_000035 [Chytriomyces hyalinus]